MKRRALCVASACTAAGLVALLLWGWPRVFAPIGTLRLSSAWSMWQVSSCGFRPGGIDATWLGEYLEYVRAFRAVDFIGDGTDMAFTARADLKLAGDWAQAKDFSAWSGEDFGAFVGGAVHWQAAETGTTATNDAMLVWTADGLVEYRGVSAMAAVMGMHTNNEAGPDFDDTGFQVELGCFLIPDKLQPFARYDYIDVDGADEMNLVAAGVNYYLAKHNAKFTADVVHAFDPLFSGRGITDPASSALGLRPDVDGQGGQTALRAQFQLLF